MTLALRSRLTLVYTAVFGLLLTALGVVSYRVLALQLDGDATANLTELISGLHGYLRFDGGMPTVVFDPNDPEQARFVHEATRYYQIFEANSGQLIVQSEALKPTGLQFTPAEVHAFRDQPRSQDLQTDYGRIRIANSLVSSAAGQAYLLQVGASLESMDRALARFLTLLLVGVPAGLIVAFLAGRWMAGVALAPLSRLAAAARTIDIADLRQRLPVRGADDELDGVASAFNDTLARLEQAVGEMRQFSAALAHELRTPLTALRGEIEMAMLQPRSGEETGRRLASQLEEIDKLKRLIDRLLTLARAEAGEIPLARDRVDLGAMSASLVDQLELVAQAKTIALERRIDDEVIVEGDARWLERLLLNLIDNALKFTSEGGRVVIHLRRDGDVAAIEVCDTGVGMAPAVVPHIFERFFRADLARSSATEGVGLGLSLAKWIVQRHNGRIDVESQPGKGSTFTVRLPLAPQ
jgi:heavy metal sensor kinase